MNWKIYFIGLILLILLLLIVYYIIVKTSDKDSYLVSEYDTHITYESRFPLWCWNATCMKVKEIKNKVYNPRYENKQDRLDKILSGIVLTVIAIIILLFI